MDNMHTAPSRPQQGKKSDTASIDLDQKATCLQIVDGNNFFYNKLIKSTELYAIRAIIRDINSCQNPPVFVFDGVRNDDRRRAIYPGYKVRKNPPNEVQQNLYQTMRLMKALLLLTNCIQVEVPTWEADDVIATLARQQSAVGKPTLIITRDKDIAQLAALSGVTVLSDIDSKMPHYLIRLYKTLKGDASDCIPGIPGFGDVAFRNCNKGEFKQLLNGKEWHPRFDGPTLGVSKSIADWISVYFGLLKSYWTIIDLMEVPDEDIGKHIQVGVSDPAAINTILSEFML
jgi:hypothetical protein